MGSKKSTFSDGTRSTILGNTLSVCKPRLEKNVSTCRCAAGGCTRIEIFVNGKDVSKNSTNVIQETLDFPGDTFAVR